MNFEFKVLVLEPGDLILLRGGKAKIVTNLSPGRVLELLKQGVGPDEILNMTMMWDDVGHDTCGFIVSKIQSKHGFEMYFALVRGQMVTIYGFHEGIEVSDRASDLHLVD